MIDGAHHSRELVTIKMTFSVLLKLLHGVHHGDQRTLELLQRTQVYFIPVVNPDGVAYIEEQETGDGQIVLKRKNGRNTGGFCGQVDQGVDLNRNYDVFWEPGHAIMDDYVCGQSYRGTEPFSEPETRTMRDFILAHKRTLKFIVNYHSYGNMFLVPYSGNH